MAWGCSTREVFLEEVDFELGFTGINAPSFKKSSNDILGRTNARAKACESKDAESQGASGRELSLKGVVP